MDEDLPGIHPDVATVLETYAPGDMALLDMDIAPLALIRFLRLQMRPWAIYADTDARWIMQAFRSRDARIEKQHKEKWHRGWIKAQHPV